MKIKRHKNYHCPLIRNQYIYPRNYNDSLFYLISVPDFATISSKTDTTVDDMDPQPEHLNIMFSPEYAVPVFGYVVPPLALLVLVTTFFMVWVLLKKPMRSPANTVLVCIAISDTITIILPVVPFVYFYTLGYYEDFVPFAWCRVFFNFVHVFPLLSNMASLWSTVALAFMRCFSVWRPLHAKSTITPFRTYLSIGCIYALSILVYVPTMFEYTFIPLSAPSLMRPNSTILSCHLQKSPAHTSQKFCFIHTWIQIIFTSLLPWFLITFPDMGLLYKLKKKRIRAENSKRRNTRY